jgi:hypothetical protein
MIRVKQIPLRTGLFKTVAEANDLAAEMKLLTEVAVTRR